MTYEEFRAAVISRTEKTEGFQSLTPDEKKKYLEEAEPVMQADYKSMIATNWTPENAIAACCFNID